MRVHTPYLIYTPGTIIPVKSDEYLVVNATRIGYTPNEITINN